MAPPKAVENWSSRFGVIMAVAGSAVGLGNFLRFPGLAAKYGGGAFMIAYFVSLLIIGVSICWAEWTLGRWGGRHGFHSSPAIFGFIVGRPWGRYLGVLGVIIPVGIYMYYVYIEAWCLGYAAQFLTGDLRPGMDFGRHFNEFVGANADGFAIKFDITQVGLFVIVVYALNFLLVYRGLAKGIEWFCKWAMPALVVIALVIVVRVLTLGTPDPAHPEQNIAHALGYMWNPAKPVVEHLVDGRWTPVETLASPDLVPARTATLTADGSERIATPSGFANLRNPELWLAAAGQIFFSLSVGFGVIITYASYLKEKDDVVLSGLTATSANEFCEVALGGMMSVPAAFLFLGAAGASGGTFGLGFNVLPHVFANMPFGGALFGFLFFFLLFLAAITSSLSMLQPGIAFIEEALGVGRRMSCALLGLLTALGSMFVWYFSQDLKALDTIDFWVGTMLIFIQGTALIILFAWVVGVDRGLREAHKGAAMRIPGIFRPIMRFVCPLFLIVIFGLWLLFNVFGWNGSLSEWAFEPTSYARDLLGGDNPHATHVARLSVGVIVITITFLTIITHLAGERWYGRNGALLREMRARDDA